MSEFPILPRYIERRKCGAEVMLDGDYKPMYWRKQRGTSPQKLDGAAPSQLSPAVAILDLWVDNQGPSESAETAWKIRDLLRFWRLLA